MGDAAGEQPTKQLPMVHDLHALVGRRLVGVKDEGHTTTFSGLPVLHNSHSSAQMHTSTHTHKQTLYYFISMNPIILPTENMG